MKIMRKVAEEDEKEGIRLKIVETGGRTLKGELQRSNPTKTHGCGDQMCVGCSVGKERAAIVVGTTSTTTQKI